MSPERGIDYGRFHQDAPVLFLPASFYPPEWRGEDSIVNPSAYLRLVPDPNTPNTGWRIEPAYDFKDKKRYRRTLSKEYYYLHVSFAAGYFDVFANDGAEREEQPVFYVIYVYNPGVAAFRQIDEEGPVYALRRIHEFVAIPGPSHIVKGVKLFLAERHALERDPQHFLKELSTPR